MGAGASTAADNDTTFDDVGKWSKEEVGEQVAAIGEAFEKYKAIAVANDVDAHSAAVSASDFVHHDIVFESSVHHDIRY